MNINENLFEQIRRLTDHRFQNPQGELAGAAYMLRQFQLAVVTIRQLTDFLASVPPASNFGNWVLPGILQGEQ